MSWPMNIDVNGYPPPVLSREMRRVLARLGKEHSRLMQFPANSRPRWSAIANPTWARWSVPRLPTLDALRSRGLVQWIPDEDGSGGIYRISAKGRALIHKY